MTIVPDGAVTLHHRDAISGMLGTGQNPVLTLLVHLRAGELRFDVCDCGNVPHPRVSDTIRYLRHLYAIASAADPKAAQDAPSFIFQTEDTPAGSPSVSWEARKCWSDVRLVPDIYYYHGLGYETFLPEIIPWEKREDQLLWRGSTTGIMRLTLDHLPSLPRYELCRIAATLGNAADCGFIAVVQGLTPDDDNAIKARLASEGLFRSYIHPQDMQRARYVIDIDGNSNSWNFIQRMRLGACMLRVESAWKQWFEDLLVPWDHYVPVKADLSDLVEKFDWCRRNPTAARQIALAGRAFATQMRYEVELEYASRTLFTRIRV